MYACKTSSQIQGTKLLHLASIQQLIDLFMYELCRCERESANSCGTTTSPHEQ
jgi:hypothetical protein